MRHRPTSIALVIVTLRLAVPGQGMAQDGHCVDIDTATPTQLERIIHIGPARALQIVELRNQRPRQVPGHRGAGGICENCGGDTVRGNGGR